MASELIRIMRPSLLLLGRRRDAFSQHAPFRNSAALLPFARTATNRRHASYALAAEFSHPPCLHRPYLLEPFQTVPFTFQRRFSTNPAEVVVPVPSLGDSITECTLNHWKKNIGDYVYPDEIVAVVDTDKVSADITSPVAGVIVAFKVLKDQTALIDDPLFTVDTTAEAPVSSSVSANETKTEVNATPPPPPTQSEQTALKPGVDNVPKQSKAPAVTNTQQLDAVASSDRNEKRVPMSRMRQRIAERLKGAQNTAAMLTTFNECDMGPLMSLRNELKDEFFTAHNVKMGFVSAFLLASTLSLKKFPTVNAYIDGNDIVYKSYADISVAVATPNGLMVPVIRDCDKKSWPALEKELSDLALRARNNKIAIEEMAGGSFTISNGGVYGSMMGTPILNPPQASILGMHAITKRAVVKNDEIVIRPMMYLALTYDHRLLDGREAVLFLNSIKSYIENPNKIFLSL